MWVPDLGWWVGGLCGVCGCWCGTSCLRFGCDGCLGFVAILDILCFGFSLWVFWILWMQCIVYILTWLVPSGMGCGILGFRGVLLAGLVVVRRVG